MPSAGPPCFLDPDLFHLNVVDGDELSIFVDQRVFMDRLAAAGHRGILAIPGSTITIDHGEISVAHPLSDAEVEAIFTDKGAHLEQYQADWAAWLAAEKASWNLPTTDLLTTLKAWWEPLLRMAPTLRDAVGAACLLRAGDLDVLIDFPAGEVRPYEGEPYAFRFEVARDLVETVVADRAVDWSNSLFLSCRFRAWREGEFNEYVYNFFKSLSVERMRRTEAEAKRKLDPPTEIEPDIEIDGYVMQRRCPHRNADLSVFGEVECQDGRDVLVCTLHGWRFDLEIGRLPDLGEPSAARAPSRAERRDGRPARSRWCLPPPTDLGGRRRRVRHQR